MSTMSCPHCKQAFADPPREGNLCPLCGVRLDAPPVAAPPVAAAQAAGPQAGALPAGALPPLSAQAKSSITGDIIGSAIVGGVIGYFWGGVIDPWGKDGLRPALLNFALFAGWGVAECAGAVLARNLRIARSRGGMVLAATVVGGMYWAVCTLVGTLLAPDATGVMTTFGAALGFVFGFMIGGGISALCVLKLTRILADNLSRPPAPPAQPGQTPP